MLFNSVGMAEKKWTIWGGANRRPSRFPNEIIKTALNLPQILHTILFEQRVSKSSQIIDGTFLFY